MAFSLEWSDFDLFLRISVYFLICHSQLKQCLQNGHWTESAWWSPLQLEHLNMWGQGSPLLVSSLGGLVLSFALQHQPKFTSISPVDTTHHLLLLSSYTEPLKHHQVQVSQPVSSLFIITLLFWYVAWYYDHDCNMCDWLVIVISNIILFLFC